MKNNKLGYLLGMLTLAAVTVGYVHAQAQGDSTDKSTTGSDVNNPGASQTTDPSYNGNANSTNAPGNTNGTSATNGTNTTSATEGAPSGLTDREIRKNIKKSIDDDKSLSSDARKVKVTAKNGKVTLSGDVASEDERINIGAKASTVVGDGNVTNDLMVK